MVPTATSTNSLVAERARAGEPAGLVIVAEHQTAGRGRLDRAWESPPRAGLTFSVLLRPDSPVARWPWLTLLAGVAVVRPLREHAGVDAQLKWPNDVLVGERKVAGMLAEATGQGALVVGIGLNVSTRRDELPHLAATSLALEGAEVTERDTLLRAILRALSDVLAHPDELRDSYRALCGTLGREVRLALPDGAEVRGVAEQVDEEGRLVVSGVAYGVGDVVHVTR